MSGDVQPKKRKDRSKKKKEELPLDEPRGTAAAFGEGDVLIHSHHDHGTGGHWCAKIVFFSLLAVLIALIGLIILENRGLSELEANEVQTQYTGLLDGWLEDAPDDHHDEHTLELKHPSEGEHDETDHESEASEEEDVELEDLEHEVSEEQVEARRYAEPFAPPLGEDDDLGEELDELDSEEEQGDDNERSQEADGDSDGEDGRTDGDDDGEQSEEDFLQQDEDEDPQELDREFATAVSSETPYEEVEESYERLPTDSLLEEEEYQREQEQLRQQAEQEGHAWLKTGVGLALIAATHALVRRARATSEEEEEQSAGGGEADEEIPAPSVPTDRRMTLLLEEPPAVVAKPKVIFGAIKPKRVIREPTPEPEPEPEPEVESEPEEVEASDPEEAEEVTVKTTTKPQQVTKKVSYDEEEDAPEVDESEEDAEDAEVIDELVEEEETGEEELSDVDDAELLTRLEAKYGKLPEPERYGVKKDGGATSMIPEEEWGEEPNEERWRRELDLAQNEMNRGLLD